MHSDSLQIRRPLSQAAAGHHELTHLAWFAACAAVAFLIPYLFSTVLELQHDWYLAIYFVLVVTLIGGYVWSTDTDLLRIWRQNWLFSLALGAAAGAYLVLNVFSRDATPHPEGFTFGFELLWRGALYGAIDGLLLSAFPAMVAFALLKGDLRRWSRKLAYAALTVLLVAVITATYHLGYDQFWDGGVGQDGIGGPEVGNAIISVPVIASANPLGSLVAHSAMHIAAAEHVYETNLFLPPQTDVN